MKFYRWHYSEGADFKSVIHFLKVRAGTSKLGLFRPKDINFLILTKFCLCLVSKLLFQKKIVFENSKISSPDPLASVPTSPRPLHTHKKIIRSNENPKMRD